MNLKESPGERSPENAVCMVRTADEEETDVTVGVAGMVGIPVKGGDEGVGKEVGRKSRKREGGEWEERERMEEEGEWEEGEWEERRG